MNENTYVVAIGLSAGGLKPLQEIIANINPNLNAVYIIAKHQDATLKTNLKGILKSPLPITYAKDNEKLKSKHIYITPSNHHITIVDDKIELYSVEDDKLKPSVNWLFESIAKYKNRAVAIILSGALNDGSSGILNIKLNGGVIIAQEPKTAEFAEMPQNAIETQLVDFIIPPKDISHILKDIIKYDLKLNITNSQTEILNKIFKLLDKNFGIDFRNYKLSTILRRIERRMYLHKLTSLDEYLLYLHKNNEEIKNLFNDLLIVVTSFCRDEIAFSNLKTELTNYILEKNKKTLKIWNIGCATGEESYSIAIIIEEIIKKHNLKLDYKIFSTDISFKAIQTARIARYPKNIVKKSFPICPQKYFIESGSCFEVNPKIREKIAFATHDILSETPLIEMDLIVCRNLLIYFKIKSQEKFFRLAHYSLNDDGLLFIGKSETIPEKNTKLFSVIDAKYKIYRKNLTLDKNLPLNSSIKETKKSKNHLSILEAIKENLIKLFNTFVIIDSKGNLLYTAGEYQKYLKIPKGVFHTNIYSFIDDELKIYIYNILSNQDITSSNYKIRLSDNKIQYINLISIPLKEFKDETYGIFFVPSSQPLEFKPSKKDCIAIEHELLITKQKLKHTLEELSTSNEELQTSNEELQSSNEELITTNEELKALNETLKQTNDELNEYKNNLEEKVQEKTKEIIEQQKLKTAIFEASKNISFILNDKKIIEANKSFLNFFNISSQQINNIKYKIVDYENKQKIDSFQELIYKDIKKIKIKKIIFEVDIIKVDKIYIINLNDITLEENQIKLLEKKVKKQLKKLRKKESLLQDQHRLSLMGMMLENISHQYKQPLHILSLNLANLELDIDNLSKDNVLKCINKANENIQFLSNTIDDFKYFFRENRKTNVNLYELINKILYFIEIDKTINNVQIINKIDKDLIIPSYPNYISQIVLNLIFNSIEALNNKDNPYIKISSKINKKYVVIEIEDNGGGVKIDNIFGYNTTSKNSLGIGLYMSKLIAKNKLKGNLKYKNIKNGAVFMLKIKNFNE